MVAEARPIIPMLAVFLPLAPIACALEGVMTGSYQIAWIAGRTIVAAAISCAWLYLAAPRFLPGLQGVWVGLLLVVAANCVLDAAKLVSPWSPLRPKPPPSD